MAIWTGWGPNIYHLSKRAARIKQVMDAIQHHNLLTPFERRQFGQLHFNKPLPGFDPDNAAPLIYSLHELLGETWLGERVLDAYMYLLSCQLSAKLPNFALILDCFFHLELTNAFTERRLTSRLQKFREDILVRSPQFVAFLINKAGVHWAPLVVDLSSRVVLQGDSAGFSPQDNLSQMIEWWLGDVTPEGGVWHARSLEVEMQSVGSGSCGLASAGAIQSFLLAAAGRSSYEVLLPRNFAEWTDSTSPIVRRNWLQAIIQAAVTAHAAEVCKNCSEAVSGYNSHSSFRPQMIAIRISILPLLRPPLRLRLYFHPLPGFLCNLIPNLTQWTNPIQSQVLTQPTYFFRPHQCRRVGLQRRTKIRH